MKRFLITGAAIIGSLISVNSMAQMSEEDAAAAVAQRKAVFQLLAYSMSPLGMMARGAEYDEEAAIQGTERLIYLADFIPEMFDRDTTGTDVETLALDSIWGSKGDFDALAADLKEGAESALEILQSQGADGIRPAIAQIGPKCGACHDRFRLDE